MKFFDKVAEISFKTDREGRTVYFPNGIFGKGFILPDSDSKAKALTFHKRQSLISFFVGLLLGILLFSHYLSIQIRLPLVIIILGIFSFMVIKAQRRIVGNFEISEEKLTFRECISNNSFLWLFAIFSLLFTLLSILIMLSDSEARARAAFGFVFFGICSILLFYFIYLKNKSDSSS